MMFCSLGVLAERGLHVRTERRLVPPRWAVLFVGGGWRKKRDPPEVVDDGPRGYLRDAPGGASLV
jgi:hypothetical protein